MAAIRLSVVAILSFAFAAPAAVAADPPRPPQPPLVNASLAEWRDELNAVYYLRDNEFLHEAAADEFRAKLAAWQGADALLDVEVVRVTKEAVICNPLPAGRVTVRNQREPAADAPQELGPGGIALRIADVVPLEVARGLRHRDTLVVRGVVASCQYQPGRSLELVIDSGRAVALVSRSYSGDSPEFRARGVNIDQLLPTPRYPADALAAGVNGQAVVQVAGEKITLSASAGNTLLDDAALQAMQRLGRRNTQQFPGEHQFTFRILER